MAHHYTIPEDIKEKDELIIGIVADTHVPDRVGNLHPQVHEVFERHSVDLILHAGDACSPQVLQDLGEIAPVAAVRGNRDVVLNRELLSKLELNLVGHQIVIMHGHGGFLIYWLDKLAHLFRGYQLKRYQKVVLSLAGDADVIIFGHTHFAAAEYVGKTLTFNPGTAGLVHKGNPPSVGIMRLKRGEPIDWEIAQMTNADKKKRFWREAKGK